MEKRNVQRYEGFRFAGREEMMTVGGGNLQQIVEVVRKVARIIRVLAELSECVDDFMEGYREGLEEARGN